MTGQPTPRSTNCSGSVTNSSPSPTGAACFRSRRRPGRRSSKTCRSEEHTSELQSLRHLVCRLLLEKKKKNQKRRGLINTTAGKKRPRGRTKALAQQVDDERHTQDTRTQNQGETHHRLHTPHTRLL